MTHRRFRFRCGLAVSLQDGTTRKITREITVEASCLALAKDYLPSVATEVCLDAGSAWFDAPPVDVRLTLVEAFC